MCRLVGLIRAFELVRSILEHILEHTCKIPRGLSVLKKSSALTHQKVESFGEAFNRATKLFMGQKQRLYQHRALCA